MHRVVAGIRHSILHVPHPDGCACGVSMITDGMRVDGRSKTLIDCLLPGFGKDLISGFSLGKTSREYILEFITPRKCAFQEIRGVIFFRLQNISVLLCIGVEAKIGNAEVDVEKISRLDHDRLWSLAENKIGFISL